MGHPVFGIDIDDLYYYPDDRTFRFRSLLGPLGAIDVIKKYGDVMIRGHQKDVLFLYKRAETVAQRKFVVYEGQTWSEPKNDVCDLLTFYLVVEIG